jgi:hypothetical protein
MPHFHVTPEQLHAQHTHLQHTYPSLYQSLLQFTHHTYPLNGHDALRIYLSLHAAYQNLSQDQPDYTFLATELYGITSWIQQSRRDPYEMYVALRYANDSFMF